MASFHGRPLIAGRIDPAGHRVSAFRYVDAPAAAVYAFLAHLPNHAHVTNGRLKLLSLATDRPGGRIAVRGPLGIRRVAETTVTELHPGRLVGGSARVGRRTSARVHWTIIADGETRCLVGLTATVGSLGPLDRLLLAVGGRRWLAEGFARAIDRLATAVDPTITMVGWADGQTA